MARHPELKPGDVFGERTVVRVGRVKKILGGYVICSCGTGEHFVSYGNLRNTKYCTSCTGKNTFDKRVKYKVGDRFGHRVIIERVGSKVAWNCDCGESGTSWVRTLIAHDRCYKCSARHRSAKIINVDGESYTAKECARILGITHQGVRHLLRRGTMDDRMREAVRNEVG